MGLRYMDCQSVRVNGQVKKRPRMLSPEPFFFDAGYFNSSFLHCFKNSRTYFRAFAWVTAE